MPDAAHFIYIPAVLIIGIVIGWILGSRAAADAFAVQQRREQARREARKPLVTQATEHTERTATERTGHEHS